MVENIDWNVGRIVKKLEELKLEEETLIVYFSDNGPNGWRWNGGLKGTKGKVDEGGVKSPCIFRWKGQLKPQKIAAICAVQDIFPTLLDMAKVQQIQQKPFDGRSLYQAMT